MVLTRAIILASLFEASDDPARWTEDLEVFLKLMCFDSAGMWRRKNEPLPAALCYSHARSMEKLLFDDCETWVRRLTSEQRAARESLERRVFYTLGFTAQRPYCCRVEEIDGPPEESWAEINAYCRTNARSHQEWVAQMSERRFGRRLRVGDAFSGMGSIPFEAASLGCEVYASDLNPVACLLTWGALNLIAGSQRFHAEVFRVQQQLYQEMDAWYLKEGLDTSAEGWRATVHLYCLEIVVPELGRLESSNCPHLAGCAKTRCLG